MIHVHLPCIQRAYPKYAQKWICCSRDAQKSRFWRDSPARRRGGAGHWAAGCGPSEGEGADIPYRVYTLCGIYLTRYIPFSVCRVHARRRGVRGACCAVPIGRQETAVSDAARGDGAASGPGLSGGDPCRSGGGSGAGRCGRGAGGADLACAGACCSPPSPGAAGAAVGNGTVRAAPDRGGCGSARLGGGRALPGVPPGETGDRCLSIPTGTDRAVRAAKPVPR
jgi:hypothetical protein